MIPRAYITAWRAMAPWQSNEQVEQDLVICRALVEIYRDEMLRELLAFRGGTALYKLYLTPAARYSEDIDLIQVKAGPIGTLFDRMREHLTFLGEPRRSQKENTSTLIYRFESEIPPVVPLRLKVEINSREHFALHGIFRRNFTVDSPWFKASVPISTFSLEELLGSKMRALYQRKKGRDLFDLWYAISQKQVDHKKVIAAFHRFLESSHVRISRKQFENNLSRKINDAAFLGDTAGLLRSGITYDPQVALTEVLDKLISNLN